MNIKTGLLAAVIALAAPVASYASTIKGDIQIDGGLTVGGNTSLTNGEIAGPFYDGDQQNWKLEGKTGYKMSGSYGKKG